MSESRMRSSRENGASCLDLYLRDITRESVPISRDEEEALAIRARQGDSAARDALLIANLGFVIMIAREYQDKGLTMQELVSAGNIGLLQAADRFDPARGFKFITYAVWWIRQSILYELMRRKKIELSTLSLDGMEPCTDDDDPNGRLLSETVSDSGPAPDHQLVSYELIPRISRLIDSLDATESLVVRMYYGLIDGREYTLDEIGAYLGRTRERARQIREKAFAKLRTMDP